MWLLSAITLLTIAHAQCNFGQWEFPFFSSIDKRTGVKLAKLRDIHSVHKVTLQEELPTPIRLVKLNYAGKVAPTIGKFKIGSQFFLNGSFVFERSTWYLVINNRQDYENPEQHLYEFQVYIKGRNYFFQRFMNIKLKNIRDNPPLLTFSPMPCKILENIAHQHTNCSATVFHADGISVKDNLKLMNNNDIFELLRPTIVSRNIKNYKLLVKKRLSFEKINLYFLDLSASDGGNHITRLRVIVQVIDVANRLPIWIKTLVSPVIYEKTENDFQLAAIDGDTGINSPICYDVLLKDDIPIKINRTTGLLHFGYFEHEKYQNDTFTFNAIAYKCADSKWRSTQDIMFTLLVKHDHIPKIILEPSEIQIQESLYETIPMQGFKVQENDLGKDSIYNLTLANNSSLEVNDAFVLVPDHGYQSTNINIFVKNPIYLDFENITWRKFQLEITATAHGDLEHRITRHLSIELLNRNDEWPQFERSTFETTVNETLAENENIGVIRAYDRDVGDTVIHTLLGQNPGIVIDPLTGIIKTTRNNTFDYEKLKQITLVIQAKDTLSTNQSDMMHTIQAILNITVLDVNDESPFIQLPKYAIKLKENTTYESLTNEIVAGDLDSKARLKTEIVWDESYTTKNGLLVALDGFHHSIYFKTLNGTRNKFSAGLFIEEGFEFILDYEKIDKIVLTVEVVDLSQEVNADSAKDKIIFEIEDINDNSPEFVAGTLNQSISVSEWATQESIIGRIEAWDRDGPGNNNVTFELIPLDDSTPPGLIAINEISGLLTVVGKIECDVPKVYELQYQIIIRDEVFKNEGKFNISIDDINNNAPQLYNTTKEVKEILENVNTGTFIETIKAFDLDRDHPHNTLEYTISTDCADPSIHNLFAIDPLSGILSVQLRNGFDLDRDSGTSFYHIPINIRDNYEQILAKHDREDSHLLLTSVSVKLLDVNDNAPQLPGAHKFRPKFFEDDDINTYSTDVLTAVDIDEPNTNNSLVAFRLLNITPAGNNAPQVDNYVNIVDISNETPNTGLLRIVKSLYGFYGLWTLEIEAYDHGEPQLKSRAFYELNVLARNSTATHIVYPKENSILNVCYTRLEALGKLFEADCQSPVPDLSADGTDEFGDVEFTLSGSDERNFGIMHINASDSMLMVKDISHLIPGNIYKLNVHAEYRNGLDANVENVQIVFVGELD